MEKSTATPFLVVLSGGIIVLNMCDLVELSNFSAETGWLFIFLFFSAVWALFSEKFAWSIPRNLLFPRIYTIVSGLKYILLFSIILLCIIPKCPLTLFEDEWPKYIGILMLIEAFVFLTSSQYQFQKVFSAKNSSESILITYGIYRLNRHPYYLGLVELGLSGALTFNSLPGLVGVFVLYIFLYWLAWIEEGVMKIGFGEEWENYCKVTPGLLMFK